VFLPAMYSIWFRIRPGSGRGSAPDPVVATAPA